MFYHLFQVLALVCYCTGGSSASGSSDDTLAFVGGAVVLPCSYSVASSSDVLTVEWSKPGLQPDVVFLYRDGCETFEMKHPDFEYRTSLIMKEMKTGNVSLRISDLKLSDAGTYKCLRIWKNATREVTEVELVVVAVSEPKLSVVSLDGAAVTLQCESSCSVPEPTMEFLDDRGTRLAAEEAHRDADASGCCSVTRRMRLQSATSRVTCRVHQPQIGQSRDAEILVSASFSSGHHIFLPVGGILLVLVFGAGGTVLFLRRRTCRSGPNTATRTSGDQSIHMTSNGAGSTITCNCETLKAELKRKLVRSNETIGPLENSPESKRSPVVCQHKQPTIVCTASPDVPKPTDTDASTSTEQRKGPDLQCKGLDLQHKGPDLKHEGPDLKHEGPDLKHKGPDLQHKGPDLKHKGPDLKHEGPNLQHKGPDLIRRHSTPQPTVASSGVSSRKKLGRSVSEYNTLPDPVSFKPPRRNSLGNMFPPVAPARYIHFPHLKEESDPLITRDPK